MCVHYDGTELSTITKSGISLQKNIQIIGINVRQFILQ
jgi:hypothetical protein